MVEEKAEASAVKPVPWFFAPWNYPHVGWRRIALVGIPIYPFLTYHLLIFFDWGRNDAISAGIWALITGAHIVLGTRELILWIRRGFIQEKEEVVATLVDKKDQREQ